MLRTALLDTAAVVRVHSNRAKKRLFGFKQIPKKLDNVPAPPVRKFAPEDKDKLPFTVHRSAFGQLPVYSDFRNGRTLVLTQLRRYAGDSQALANELSAVCGGAPVRIRGGRMEVKGRHRETVCGWLASMGF